MRDRIRDLLLESIQVKEDLMRSKIEEIMAVTNAVVESLKKGGKIMLCGNGGSASDSQHIAAELVGRFQKERRALAAIALTVNTSVLTALANDYGYESVFARQVEALGGKNDCLIGISTSGKARNVSAAVKQAQKMGIKTVILTGSDGAELARAADLSLMVPSKVTARIQEAHIAVGHIICEMAEQQLC